MENGTSLGGHSSLSRPLGVLGSSDGVVASGNTLHASRGYLITRFFSEEAGFGMGRTLAQTDKYGQQPFYLVVPDDDANIPHEWQRYSLQHFPGEGEVNFSARTWAGIYTRQWLHSWDWAVSARQTALTGIPDIHDIPDKQSIAEICDVIRSFSLYQPGWKGEGSVAPPQAEIDNAVKFIEAIPFRIVQPKAMIGSDGDVGFTWRCGDDYLEVGFMDGEMSFCCQKSGEWQYGDFAFTGSIPETLLHSVWRVAGDG